MVGVRNMFGELSAKLVAGEPLSATERRMIADTGDLLTVGMLADEARRRLHDARVTFVRVARVPCRVETTPALPIPPGAGEIRIDGPLPDVAQARARIAEVIAAAGGRPVSAFTLGDLLSHASETGKSLRALLDHLRDAGLESLSEAEWDRLPDPHAAFEAIAESGLQLQRVTVHQPPRRDVVSFLDHLRSAQAALGLLRAFAPLPRTLSSVTPSTGYDDVKQVALARILLDNVRTIQVDWSVYGPKLAQVALTFGADDLDAVSPVTDSPTGGWRRSSLEEVRRNITAAGLVPAERNGRFEIL